MKIRPYATILSLPLLASNVAAHPLGIPQGMAARTIPNPTEATALRARCDASLESLRAGRIELPSLLDAEDRAELRSAESQSGDLLELRAGVLTDHDWTMIAIGALVVLIIVLI